MLEQNMLLYQNVFARAAKHLHQAMTDDETYSVVTLVIIM